jgi:HAE1 family hydrophobic/amphiphilic exporter-1
MSLPSFSVRRPVTVTMIFLGVVLLGIISLSRLPQELFPPITYPQLTVVTNYPNTAPEEVETLITKLIEEAVGTVKNARRVISTSREGVSVVIVEFNWGTDMNFAALGMREKIDLMKERLPRDAEEPIVMKFNPFARPIMSLSISGERPLDELYEISKRYIKDRLEKVEGVASCSITGGIKREIHVDINSGAVYNSGIGLLTVVNSLRDANLNYPAGTTKEEFFEWLVRTIGEFNAVSEIDSIVIGIDKSEEERYGLESERESALRKRRLIKLSDVATIKDGFRERASYSRYNGKENVSVAIQKQAEANTIRTVQKVLKEMNKIEEILPERVIISIDYDQSKFIRSAINGVTGAALQGGILALLVLLFFFRNIKNSIIVAFAIPVSVMAAFSLMYFSGISVNIISFGGLALGIGMLVDNAIVVMENVFRHRKGLGKKIHNAAIKGTEEVNSAITASTLTTVAVFLPLAFVIGIAGQIFKDLAFTITFSVLASLFVALSLIPRLAITGEGKELTHLKIIRDADRWLKRLSESYSQILKDFLANRKKGLTIIFSVFIASLFLFNFIGKEFMPKVDEGQFIIKLDMPPGIKLDVTNEVSGRIEDEILDMKYVKSVSATVGSNREETGTSGSVEMLKDNQAEIAVNLKKKRRINTDRFIQQLKKRLDSVDLEDGKTKFVLTQSLMQSAFQEEGAPIVVEIKGADLDVLTAISESVIAGIGKIRGIYDIKSSMEEPAPETKILVNKNKAALYDLSVRDIALTSQIAIDGWIATKFKEEGEEIDIRVRLREEDRKDFSIIKQIRVISPDGAGVSLGELTDFKLGEGPSEIKRVDKERTILVYANVFGRKMNEVLREISNFLNKMEMPPEYRKPELGGEREQMSESFASLRFALILAILVVYMIMAAQFESLWQPFVIMFTLPLSVIGIALALFITRTTLNVVAILGIIVLGGIVVNNAIVLIDYINNLIRLGKKASDAVVEAANTRLRPILMTTLTTVLGLLPLALGIGEGGELISPLAITVMGGLLVSTFLTLVVIPAVYLIADEFLARHR